MRKNYDHKHIFGTIGLNLVMVAKSLIPTKKLDQGNGLSKGNEGIQ
jgi:hypothetical protein